MVKFGWDKLKRFLAQSNSWTGQQTFSNIAITGGTITGTTINENFTTSTNPASSVATTTAIVDAYNGVLITTNVNNTQTIANPTAATVKTFTVVNNDTSASNQTVKANSVDFVLTPGEGQCFLWDGSAWGPTDLGITSIPVPVTQGGTGLATITDHGIMLGSGTTAITPLGVATDGQIPIGSSGLDPVLAAITPGDGIDVTNAAGAITVAVDIKANGGLVIDTTELTVDLGASAITGTLAVGDGGSGASTLTDHGVLLGSGTDPITPLGVATNGQLVIGSTGADPVIASITDGEGIDTTGGAGTLTIACEDATTANKGVTVYSGSTKALAGTDTESAMTPADVAAKVAVDVNLRAMSQGVAMTYAASGSSGITVADNDNIDFGTGNFALVWKGSLPDWTAAIVRRLIRKYGGPGYFQLYVHPDNKLQFSYGGTSVASSISYSSLAQTFVNNTIHEIVLTISVGATQTTITPYIDGVAFGAAIVVDNVGDISSANPLYISGTDIYRTASTTHHAITFNRALTAAEVLDLYRNGIAVKHRKASQTALTSGTLVAGQEYTIDTFAAGDDFANVGGTNETGNVFVATGTAPTTWANSSSLRATGGTLILEPEGIQPVQWLDAGANRLHAMQPAAGSRLTRTKRDFTIKWTNTWSGTHELQYIGGINQAILPPNCYIDSIIGVIAGGTIEDIIIGDGSDTDRWVTITTGLAAGTVAFTIANAISDGTNYKMTVDPDANFTGSIAWTINGKIL